MADLNVSYDSFEANDKASPWFITSNSI